MKQSLIFLSSEGDRWFERNRNARVGVIDDPVQTAIEKIGLKPRDVLEIGCSYGWRLAELREKYGCNVMGVEPSREACIEAAARQVPVVQTTASSLSGIASRYDVVIYGFCLYLTDPEDWLRIVAEGDAVLSNGGYLVIHDFADLNRPFARKYTHCEGVLSYHFDFASLWLSHPIYSVVYRDMLDANQYMVTVLKKGHPSSIKVMPW